MNAGYLVLHLYTTYVRTSPFQRNPFSSYLLSFYYLIVVVLTLQCKAYTVGYNPKKMQFLGEKPHIVCLYDNYHAKPLVHTLFTALFFHLQSE